MCVVVLAPFAGWQPASTSVSPHAALCVLYIYIYIYIHVCVLWVYMFFMDAVSVAFVCMQMI